MKMIILAIFHENVTFLNHKITKKKKKKTPAQSETAFSFDNSKYLIH